MNENWIKNGQEAVNDDDYVKLNAGLMKVSDLNDYLASFLAVCLALISSESLYTISNCRK